MARTDPQVNVRMPAELKEQLEAAARESGRSVTGELIHRLQLSFVADAIEMGDTETSGDEIATALALKVLEVFGTTQDKAQADRWKERVAAGRIAKAARKRVKKD